MKKGIYLLILVLITVISTSEVFAQVTANPPSDLYMCDDNNDGIAIFDLTITEPEIIGGQDPTNLVVTFYVTQADADNNVNVIVLPNAYNNTINPQTIFARLENNTTGEFDTTSFNLFVLMPPETIVISNLVVIDEDGDGFEVFDLTSKIPEILNGQTDINVTFYETEDDANNNVTIIASPENYMNITNPQTIYARLENIETSCFAVTEFDLVADINLNVEDQSLRSLKLYPNPTSEIVNLKFNGSVEKISITLYNLLGQELANFEQQLDNGNTSIDISELKSGIYFIKVESGNYSTIKKVVKN